MEIVCNYNWFMLLSLTIMHECNWMKWFCGWFLFACWVVFNSLWYNLTWSLFIVDQQMRDFIRKNYICNYVYYCKMFFNRIFINKLSHVVSIMLEQQFVCKFVYMFCKHNSSYVYVYVFVIVENHMLQFWVGWKPYQWVCSS